MWQRFGIGIAGVSCLLLAPTLASAQSIGGTVTDETGGVLPGVTVEARSPALIEQVRAAVSDGAGQYLIVQLEPGVYSVTFTLPGFSTFVRDGVELLGQVTANVDGQLQVGAVEETITVTGASPTVDVQNVQQQAVMTREIIDAIPTGRNINNLAVLVPGMQTGTTYGVGQDVGGQSGQSQQEVMIHGGSEDDQRLTVEGMAANGWMIPSVSRVWFSDGNYEEIQVTHSAGSAEIETGGVHFNMIPRSGGNTFSSRNYFSFSDPAFQSDNVSDQLAEELLFDVNKLKELWTVNPSIGGPIMRDKLWFFGAYTRTVADNFVAFQKDLDPNAFVYEPDPDPSRQAFDDQDQHDVTLRLTWQASANNKLQFYVNDSTVCHCHFIIGTAVQSINIMDSGSPITTYETQQYNGTWTSTLTNRLLLEAGFGTLPGQEVHWRNQPEVDSSLPGIFEVLAGRVGSRGFGGWFGARSQRDLDDSTATGRASLSYVTGSHAFKAGTVMVFGSSGQAFDTNDFAYAIRTGFGNPVQANFAKWPQSSRDKSQAIALYAQDQWTLDRLTVNAGVRFDYFHTWYPDQQQLETKYAPGAAIEGADVATWKDLSPRLGIVYDVFGNGRTAVKATASRFVSGQGPGLSRSVNPAFQNGESARTWIDRLCFPSAANPTPVCIAGDREVQGDPLDPFPNGELLSSSPNVNFGTPILSTFYDEDWAFGWGNRFSNWEFSAGVQHELTDGLSVNVSYFRRIYTSFDVNDNRAVTSADYDPYCINVPTDPRLPNSGQQLCDLFEVTPAKFGQVENLRTGTDSFGKQQQHWNGIDLTVNARMDNGLLLQGGVSTGRQSEDDCEFAAALDNPSTLYCAWQTPFLTQVKFLSSYTLPYDIQIAGTFQSLPGNEILANMTFPSSQISAGLGRPSNTATTAIQVIEPGTEYTERLNQFDLRLTKILTFGPSRVRAMFDIYNLFNDSTPLQRNNQYGATGPTWQSPQLVIPGRLIKFAFQLDF